MEEFKHFGETIRIRGGNIDSIECSNDIPGIIVNVTPETLRPVTGYTGACFYHPLGSSETKIIGKETKIKLDRDVLTTFDWAYAKQNSKYRIKKIQSNPKKNATTVIFENGHVEVVKRNELDPEADLYFVVAYAVAKYVYGSNSAFKRQIRDCIFESLEVK